MLVFPRGHLGRINPRRSMLAVQRDSRTENVSVPRTCLSEGILEHIRSPLLRARLSDGVPGQTRSLFVHACLPEGILGQTRSPVLQYYEEYLDG